MNLELRHVADLVLFVKIVQYGGISRCASELGMERTTVSRRLKALETCFGVELLSRTPNSMSITKAGLRCYEHCEKILSAVAEAQRAASGESAEPVPTTLVFGAPADLFSEHIQPVLQEYAQQDAFLNIEFRPVQGWKSARDNHCDAAVCLAPVAANGATRFRIATAAQGVYAAPEFLRKFGEPESPADLKDFPCAIEQQGSGPTTWRFESNGCPTTARIDVRYVVDNPSSVREAVCAGIALGRLPDYACHSAIQSGNLVKVLTNYSAGTRDVLFIAAKTALKKRGLMRLKTFIEANLALA